MKLEYLLDKLNSLEKSSFLKVINNLLSNLTDSSAVDEILNRTGRDLKSVDSAQMAEVFKIVAPLYAKYVREEYTKTSSQLDILLNIITRDGNCILRQDWLYRLYEEEVKRQNKAISVFKSSLNSDKPSIEPERIRDYKIYEACLHAAYHNDEQSNFDPKISIDEQNLLDTLAERLELAQDERTMIKYAVIGIPKMAVDELISYLKELGAIFYSKKNMTVYVADEVVTVLRKVKGKDVADKYFRRVLRQLREPQLNVVCRKHGIDIKLPINEKITQLLNSGISFSSVLKEELYKPDVKVVERRKFIGELCDEKLKIVPSIKGASLDDKVANLISYYDKLYEDDKLGISTGGYEKLLNDLGDTIPNIKKILKDSFQFQEDNVLNAEYLTEYGVMPRDILELLSEDDIQTFCEAFGIKTRGGAIENIMEAYKDSENLLVENYVNIGNRDLNALKRNGIFIKEAELGSKFEDVTRFIFSKLGFNVDEDLRRKLNTEKDKMDILLTVSDGTVVLIECKTSKESGYNKFTAISRQVRSYRTLLEKNGYRIAKILVVAPDFSEDFVADCNDDFELNLGLLRASSLYAIYLASKEYEKTVTVQMLMKDVLIDEARIIRALKR